MLYLLVLSQRKVCIDVLCKYCSTSLKIHDGEQGEGT